MLILACAGAIVKLSMCWRKSHRFATLILTSQGCIVKQAASSKTQEDNTRARECNMLLLLLSIAPSPHQACSTSRHAGMFVKTLWQHRKQHGKSAKTDRARVRARVEERVRARGLRKLRWVFSYWENKTHSKNQKGGVRG